MSTRAAARTRHFYLGQTRKPSLATRARRSLFRSLAAQGAVLFLCAGNLGYGQAWLYLAFTAVSTLATNAYLMRSNPGLLERRLAVEEEGETERVQKLFFALLRIVGLVMLTVAGLDRRFGWSSVSPWTAACAYLVLCIGAVLVVLVFRENAHGSSVIEVTEEQRVVASGPYRWVRHPMYAPVDVEPSRRTMRTCRSRGVWSRCLASAASIAKSSE